MRCFSVSARGSSAVRVQGANWIVALGSGLERLGRADDLRRLACEVLPNGTVIARDVGSGAGYVVQELDPTDPASRIAAAESAEVASEAALELARSATGAESGAVILDAGGSLRFVAVAGPHAHELVGVQLAPGTGVAGFAIERRRTVVLSDAHGDPRHCGEIDARTGYTTRQLLVVPVACEGAVYGALELLNLPDDRCFGEGDVDEAIEVAGALAERLARG